MSLERSPLSLRELSTRAQVRIVVLVGAIALAGILLVWTLGRARAEGAPDSSSSAPSSGAVKLTANQLATLEIKPVAARVFRSERITDGRIALNGDTTTQVFSPYSGRVIRVLASPGERVHKGAALLEVDAGEFAQARADLRNTNAALQLARTNEARKHAAFESQGGSQQDWQQAQSDLAAAEAANNLARNHLRIFGRTDAQIDALDKGTSADARAFIDSPVDGIITDRQVGPGQFLQSGSSTPVFAVADLSTVWLVAQVPETDAPLVKVGDEIEVHVLAFARETFKARLTAVAAEVDPVTHRVAVRATVPNPDGRLRPQMFATFAIIVGEPSSAVAVPEEAVVREGDQAHVWVVSADNSLSLRAIRTGRVTAGSVEVLDGLRVGERIVTRGSLFIDRAARPG